MIYLNPTQEKHLIRYVINFPKLFSASGAARAVFECTTDIADYLHLPEKDHGRYVMKIALGTGGMKQMVNEYKTYEEYKHSHVLAEIVAIGRYVEIMEAVDVWDFRDEADYGEEVTEDDIYCNNDSCLTRDEAQIIANTIRALTYLFGCTSDNGQIGRNHKGEWVAYDYGFIPEQGSRNQTSDISDDIEDTEYRQEYMTGLLDLLNQEEDLMRSWEIKFLSKHGMKPDDDDN